MRFFLREIGTSDAGPKPDNGPPLFLIHGQMVSWEDYVKVLPELSGHFHIFAVDCHGHGKSGKDPGKSWLIRQIAITHG